jgi:hypothetical protein
MLHFFILELFDFHTRRRPRNSKFSSGTIWHSDLSSPSARALFEAFLLTLLEGCLRDDPMTLYLRESTIHEQFNSRDVATVVRCQKHHGFSSLIGRSEPFEWNGLGDHLFAFLAYRGRSQ